ncbi:MAG TPA: cation diffusion facilitator family transporter [bacterium]
MAVHTHQRKADSGRTALVVAFLATLAMMAIEWVAGLLSGSLALIADAGHMLTDSSALALSLFASWIVARPVTPEKTYGYYRTEILAALVNGVALWLLVIWIVVNAVQRLAAPPVVDSGPMIVVAAFGLAVNLIVGWRLAKAGRSNLNIQGAWLNVMSDALGSLGVIVAGVLVRLYGWHAADAIASMLISVLIAASSWQLVTRSVNVLLEGTPAHLDTREVIRAIRAVPGVRDVHDVHLWTITTGLEAMSGHVLVEDIGRSAATLEELNRVLSERFGIAHTTFQLEPPG